MASDLSLETISSLSLIPVERLKLIEAESTAPHEHETALLNQLLVGDTALTTDEAIGIAEPATAYLSPNTISKEIVLSQLKAIFSTVPKLRQVWCLGRLQEQIRSFSTTSTWPSPPTKAFRISM